MILFHSGLGSGAHLGSCFCVFINSGSVTPVCVPVNAEPSLLTNGYKFSVKCGMADRLVPN